MTTSSRYSRTSVLIGTAGALALTVAPDWTMAAPGEPGEVLQSGASDSAGEANIALEEITVTARKRSESLVEVPTSITAFGSTTLSEFNVQNFADYATKVPNLSFNNAAGGASTGGSTQTTAIQIRGISGLNTTGFYIDDTPVPSTIDPRVVDLQRIEVLKGPQGTLYGASSMGGNVRLLTNQPNFEGNDVSYMAQVGGTSGGGSPDYGGNFIANLVAVPDLLTFRVMAFGQHDAGFLTNTYPAPDGVGSLSSGNQNQITTYGGSIAGLLKVTDRFQVTLKLMGQQKDYYGLPEAYAPLPSFTPIYNLDRSNASQEYAHDRFMLAALEAKYNGDGYSLTSSTSYFYNNSVEVENGTEGADEFIGQNFGVTLDPANALIAPQGLLNHNFTEEARLSVDPVHDFSGVFGVYYSHQDTGYDLEPQNLVGLAENGLWPTDLLIQGQETKIENDAALFGELYYKFLNDFTLTLGGRYFYLEQSILGSYDGLFTDGPYSTGLLKTDQTGFSPKVALSYALTPDANVYALYSRGFRAGGPEAALPSTCEAEAAAYGLNTSLYKSDTVDNYELGAKSSFLGGRAYITAAAFQINWNNIQQTVYLPCSSSFTANTGEARIRGGELEVNGQLFHGFDVRAGVGYESAIITNPGDSPLAAGERVFQVPKVNATMGFNYSIDVDWPYRPFISADYSYVGDRLSGTGSETSPLLEPAYSLVNARLGVTFGKSTLSLYANNLTNTKVNLGDIQPISLGQTTVNAQGNIVPYPRVGVLQPLTLGLQYKHAF